MVDHFAPAVRRIGAEVVDEIQRLFHTELTPAAALALPDAAVHPCHGRGVEFGFDAGQSSSRRSVTLDKMTQNKAAVVDAAKRWLAAKEDMLAADLTGEHRAETEHALDAAEYELTDA